MCVSLRLIEREPGISIKYTNKAMEEERKKERKAIVVRNLVL